jgi:hypothetical protein
LKNWLRDIQTPAIPPPPPPLQPMMPPVYITTNFTCEDKIPKAQFNHEQKRLRFLLAPKLKGQNKPKSK